MKITKEEIEKAHEKVYDSIDSALTDEEKDARCVEAFGFTTTELMDLGAEILIPYGIRRSKEIVKLFNELSGNPMELVTQLVGEVSLAFTLGFLHAVALAEEQASAGVA